jgi:D,D-heptose 1,7-bisphosphate phosphatase
MIKPVTQCAVLVGGLGTRMGRLTANIPKPLLPIGKRVFLDYLVDEIARHGFSQLVCLAGYRGDDIKSWALNAKRSGLEIQVVVEPEPCGTAGALVAAKDLLDDEFLLFNGDTIFDINLLDLAAWKPAGKSMGVVALRSIADAERYGVVEVDGDTIRTFAERPCFHGPGLINGGIYRLKRDLLKSIASIPSSIERDVFPMLAREGLLRGRAYDRFFLDVGTRETFKAAQSLLPEMVRRPALFLDRDGVVNKDVGYAYKSDHIEWVDGIFQAVKAANDAGTYVFVVTNQAGVARGLYAESAVTQLHQWMNRQFRAVGAHVDDFAYCPHHPTVGNGPYTCACMCRKPAPGMLLNLARRWPVDLSRSLLVGDKDVDLQAADNAGVVGIQYNGGSVRVAIDAWLNAVSHRVPQLQSAPKFNLEPYPDGSRR